MKGRSHEAQTTQQCRGRCHFIASADAPLSSDPAGKLELINVSSRRTDVRMIAYRCPKPLIDLNCLK